MFKALLITMASLVLAGCTSITDFLSTQPTYYVDYCGQKDMYENAKDSYKAGERVSILYSMIATDTDYSFYLNGNYISPTYTEKGNGGFEITFTMPEYDVKLECKSRNSMVYVPEDQTEQEQEEETMLFEYLRKNADGGYYRLMLVQAFDNEGDSFVRLDAYSKENADTAEEKSSYTASYIAFISCCEIANNYGFYSWDIRRDTESFDGNEIVCRYLSDSKELVTVSTLKMPKNTEVAFEDIRKVIEKYICEENRI